MTYRIRYNRSTVHIEGIPTLTEGTQLDYARSACPALSRSATRMAVGAETDTVADALAEAARNAKATGRNVCRTCEAAATALRDHQDETERLRAQAEVADEAAESIVETTGRARHFRVFNYLPGGALELRGWQIEDGDGLFIAHVDASDGEAKVHEIREAFADRVGRYAFQIIHESMPDDSTRGFIAARGGGVVATAYRDRSGTWNVRDGRDGRKVASIPPEVYSIRPVIKALHFHALHLDEPRVSVWADPSAGRVLPAVAVAGLEEGMRVVALEDTLGRGSGVYTVKAVHWRRHEPRVWFAETGTFLPGESPTEEGVTGWVLPGVTLP